VVTTVNSLYADYFSSPSESPEKAKDWVKFVDVDRKILPLSKCKPDFSVNAKTTWKDTAKKILIVILKIVIFPWGLYELAKFICQRIIMTPLFPMQSRIVKIFISLFTSNLVQKFAKTDQRFINALKEIFDNKTRNRNLNTIISSSLYPPLGHKVIIKQVVLEKNGKRYTGILSGYKEYINNGKWAIQATGNCEPSEMSALHMISIYGEKQYNTLLINPPGAGSQGRATPTTMGEAQEIGISFLETALKATDIVMAGRSLGNATVGQAILQHTFIDEIKYTAISQMTFDRVSTIAGAFAKMFTPISCLKGITSKIVTKIAKWCCEMDSVAAAKKLERLKIPHIVVQSASRKFENVIPEPKFFTQDQVIPAEASLGFALATEKVTKNKIFIGLQTDDHMTDDAIKETLKYL